MTLTILCSGQGLQHAGMFRLSENEGSALRLFDHAAKLLGQDPRLFVRSPGAELFENRAGQILCTLQPLAIHAALGETLQGSRIVAGYSVGEIAAWSIAGLLEPLQTLDLIAKRAEVMDAASGINDGLLFVRGVQLDNVDALCRKQDLGLAIINPGDAYVLGGTSEHLAAAMQDAHAYGTERVIRLAVKVASHTKKLASASIRFREILEQVSPNDLAPDVRLLSGIDAAPVLDKRRGLDKLAAQISQTIQWADCLSACVEAGTSVFLELGPGRALAEMASATYPHIPARSVDDFKSLQGIRLWLERYNLTH